MLNKAMIKTVPFTLGLFFLVACATTNGADTAAKTSAEALSAKEIETITEAMAAKEVADTLSQANSVATSEDGRMVCKRVKVVGSNFRRKVCASADEWAARAEADRKTTDGIQRGGGAPGVGN